MKKEEEEKGEQGDFSVTIKISGSTLRHVMAVRGEREKYTGRLTSIAELVREAVRYWYKSKGMEMLQNE